MPGDWYVSGDSAYMDEDGYFWFQGRIDDVIMTSGERVGPFEVESKLIEHAAAAEAGVIGIPDPVRTPFFQAASTVAIASSSGILRYIFPSGAVPNPIFSFSNLLIIDILLKCI